MFTRSHSNIVFCFTGIFGVAATTQKFMKWDHSSKGIVSLKRNKLHYGNIFWKQLYRQGFIIIENYPWYERTTRMSLLDTLKLIFTETHKGAIILNEYLIFNFQFSIISYQRLSNFLRSKDLISFELQYHPICMFSHRSCNTY